MSIGCLSCSYSYGGSRQAKRAGSCAPEFGHQFHRVRTGRKRARSSHVDLAAAARLLRVLLERRLEERRPEVHARQLRARSSRRRAAPPSIHGAPMSSNGRVVPRPSDSMRAFEQHGARIDDRAVERRHVRRRHDPRQAGLVEVHRSRVQPSSGTTSSARADAELVVEQARELADRHAVAQRDRELADERRVAGVERGCLRCRRRRSGWAGRRRRPARRVAPPRACSWPSCRCRCRRGCRHPADR